MEKARDEAEARPSERRARRRRARKSSDAARDSQKEKPGRRFESGASSASGDRTRAARRPDSPSACQHAARNIRRAGDVGGAEESAAENCPARDAGEKLAAANADGACPWASSAATVCMGRSGWFSPRCSRVIPDALADEQQKMPRTARVGGHHGGLQRAQQRRVLRHDLGKGIRQVAQGAARASRARTHRKADGGRAGEPAPGCGGGGKNTEQGHGAPPFCLACPKDENIRA
ncbi:MAG: hypothetical protein ACLVB5_07425 [Christensenellales bacterium]